MGAAAAQPATPAAPQPAASAAARPLYRSAFEGYRRFNDQAVTPWRDSNDLVGRIGGWQAYAREGQASEGPASAPAPAAPASGAPLRP